MRLCDGISPRDALERGRGWQKGYSKAKRLRQEELLVAPTLRRSKRTKVVMGDDDSTWLPAVVKRKVAPKKTFKTIQNTNICVEVPIEKKQGKLLNTLLRNKEKKQVSIIRIRVRLVQLVPKQMMMTLMVKTRL